MTAWTLSRQVPLSVRFSKQEYWSGLPFPNPGDGPDPGIELLSPVSPALADEFFTTSITWEVPSVKSPKSGHFGAQRPNVQNN